jgi:hypothetical protein
MTLTNGELTQVRGDLEATLPDTCAITPQTKTADGAGGWTVADGTATNVACRYFPDRNPTEAVSNSRQRGVRTWIVELPQGTSVSASDHIVVDGLTFEVVGFETQSDELLRRVRCRETT